MKMSSSQLVEKILSENRISPISRVSPRDSDKEMLIQLLQYCGANLTPEQLAVFRSVNMESARRTRQKMQRLGKYPASPEVKKERDHKALRVQQNAPNATPETLGKIISEPTQAPVVQQLLDWAAKPKRSYR